MIETDQQSDGTRPFRVLTLDGGGMRGLYTACVLRHLADRYRPPTRIESLDIGRGFDLIVGTSTGSILAFGIALGIQVDKIIEFYEHEGPRIFSNSMPDRTRRRHFYPWLWKCKSRSANTNSHLRKVLQGIFQDITLASLYKTRGIAVCVPSVNVLTQHPRVFKTPHDSEKQMDVDYRLVDVCLASSAAPVFLPLIELPVPSSPSIKHIYADGGLWANNPILVGLIEALRMIPVGRPIQLLSISTSPPPEGESFDHSDLNLGLSQWDVGIKALSLSMNAQSASAVYFAKFLCDYFRKNGRVIDFVRLPTTSPSVQEAKELLVDRATPHSLNLLKSLGDTVITNGVTSKNTAERSPFTV